MKLMTQKKANKKPNKFRHELLTHKYWSIVYVEGKGFFASFVKSLMQ